MMYAVNRFTQTVKEVEDISTLENAVFVFETQVAAETFADAQRVKRISEYQKHIDKMKSKQSKNKNK